MASLPPGTLLGGRYELVKEINRGGTAIVYSATDSASGRLVALKVITAGTRVPASAIKREISVAAGLQGCPYVVQLLDFFANGEDQAVLVVSRQLRHVPAALPLLPTSAGPYPVAMLPLLDDKPSFTFVAVGAGGGARSARPAERARRPHAGAGSRTLLCTACEWQAGAACAAHTCCGHRSSTWPAVAHGCVQARAALARP